MLLLNEPLVDAKSYKIVDKASEVRYSKELFHYLTELAQFYLTSKFIKGKCINGAYTGLRHISVSTNKCPLTSTKERFGGEK